MAHYKMILKKKSGNVDAGFVDHVEDGGYAYGIITDEEGKKLGDHCSTTLDWLEHDLLRHVPFNKDIDTYEKNW